MMRSCCVCFFGAVLVLRMVTPAITACDSKWIPRDGYEYRYYKERKNFRDAQQICSGGDNLDGNLVSVHGNAEWKFVQTGLICDSSTEVWIGMTLVKGNRSSAKWIDGTDSDFIHELPKADFEVDNGDPGVLTARMKKRSKGNWYWDDTTAGPQNSFICKRVKCGAGYIGPYSSFEYRYHTSRKALKNATLSCLQEDGNLVSIHSESEWELVQGLVCNGAGNVWLGMVIEKAKNKSSAKWLDQSKLDYEPAVFTLDNGGDKPIGVRMQKKSGSWKWNDRSASTSWRYICKRGPVKIPSKPKITSRIAKGEIPSGCSLTLNCMKGSPDEIVDLFQWSFENGNPVQTFSRRRGVHKRLASATVAGNYSCKVINRKGQAQSEIFTVKVIDTKCSCGKVVNKYGLQSDIRKTEIVPNIEECQKKCILAIEKSDGACRAITYNRTDKKCFLHSKTKDEAVPGNYQPKTDWQYMEPVCPGRTTPKTIVASTTNAPPPVNPPPTTSTGMVSPNPVPSSTVQSGPNVPTEAKTTTTTTTTIAPKVYTSRKDVQAGYTRSPTPCQSQEWAYGNLTGNCYLFFSDGATQDEAIEVCSEKNATLLSIENQDEQNFVDDVLRFDFNDQWTLGRKNEFGNFTFNGTEITYENWLTDNLLTKPKDGEQVCIALVKIYYKGFYLLKWKWDTKPCGEKKSFVCQHSAKRCPPLPLVDFVEPHPPKPFIDLTINYTCLPGYKMPNYTLRYQEWQRDEPVGDDVAANVTEAWKALKPNITTMPSMTYECLFPGKWSDGSLAPCEPKSCKEPPEVKHAERNSSDRVFPAWIEYKCAHGYHYEYDNTSAKVAWCSPDEEWIDVPPDCSPVECGDFPPVGNATVSSVYKNRYRDTVVWTCIPGFMFPDRAVRQWVGCRENYVNWQIGRWNLSKLPDCTPLQCLEPPNPANTTRNSNATVYRSIISYRCVSDEFEFPSGDEELFTQCNMEALWRPSVPHCRKKPPKLKMKGKKYAPPPKESPEAKTVGTLAVAIMAVLLVLMVLLDLGSWYQGYRYLRYNLGTFCRYYGFVSGGQAAPSPPSQPTGPIHYIPHNSVHPLNTRARSEVGSYMYFE